MSGGPGEETKRPGPWPTSPSAPEEASEASPSGGPGPLPEASGASTTHAGLRLAAAEDGPTAPPGVGAEPDPAASSPGSRNLPGLEAPSPEEQERMVEAILFASSEPLTAAQIAERLPPGCDPRSALDRLRRRYEGRGVALTRAGAAWAFRTAPDLRFLLAREVVETRKLSRAGIETLAIVAYHGPVTRTEIEEIRGVSVSRGTLDQLIELGWVRLGRRRETPGRPATFVTTDAFLDHFGLESARDLPGLSELKAAGFLGDPTVQEALPLPDPEEP